jgi:hypothetical protein
VYALLAVVAGNGSVLTWTVPIAPESWDSLVLDCNVQQFIPLGALITDPLAGGTDALEVSFHELPFERGLDFGCGSVFAFRIDASQTDDPDEPISADIRVANRSDRDAQDGLGPSPDSGFILVEASAPRDLAAQITVSWEDAESRVFQSALSFSGRETDYGFLLACPVERFALGALDDDSLAGATLAQSGDLVPAPPPLTLGDQTCGGTITIELTKPTGSDGYQLNLSADPLTPEQSSTMYDRVREVLEAQGLADQPSSLLSLLPPSVVTEGTP